MPVDAAIIGGKHASNRVKLAVEFDRLTDHVRVRMQTLAPEAVAYNSDFVSRDFVYLVALGIEPALGCANVEHVEEVGAGGEGPNDVVGLRARDALMDAAMKRQILKRTGAAQVPVQGVRGVGAAHES